MIKAEDIEVDLFIEAIYRKYGHDFRGYSKAHMKRRILNRVHLAQYPSIPALMHDVLRSQELFEQVQADFSINVTEMYRDPPFFQFLREEIVPLLKTYPKVKVWHAGCSSGEEVYSMAILLKEEGLYDRVQIYATDFNEAVLQRAKEGIFPLDAVKEYTANYQRSGGLSTFSDYYTAGYDSVIMDQSIKQNIVFAQHNLVTDGVFGQMHVIICRNVLIYFTKPLQDQVFHLFDESLRVGGYLCLGTKETLHGSSVMDQYLAVEDTLKIYRKTMSP